MVYRVLYCGCRLFCVCVFSLCCRDLVVFIEADTYVLCMWLLRRFVWADVWNLCCAVNVVAEFNWCGCCSVTYVLSIEYHSLWEVSCPRERRICLYIRRSFVLIRRMSRCSYPILSIFFIYNHFCKNSLVPIFIIQEYSVPVLYCYLDCWLHWTFLGVV
jgi:hypothetical protein